MPDNQLILGLVRAGALGEVYYGEGNICTTYSR